MALPVASIAGRAVTGSGAGAAPILEVDHLRKVYQVDGAPKVAIEDISFHVDKGEFVCIVGPSGAGKTTLLRCLSGLMPQTSGEVKLDGTALGGVPQELSIVFQDYSRSLFPWLRVGSNVELPLKTQRMPKSERVERVSTALAEVGLSGTERSYPWQLSGGMQQRVAIARCLVSRPTLLLMDEPFASVDAQTRFDLEDLTLKVRNDLGVTVVLVTHDIDEAVYLADRIVVLGRAPSTVSAILDVPFGSTRSQAETRNDPAFAELRTTVLKLVTDP